jgi:NifU-like protein involved in Fe-S cluster formation
VAAQSPAKLYSPALLALATELANFPLDDRFAHRAEARSRTCGSVIAMGLTLDDAGRVTDIGMQVSACAIGQASAALLARNAADCDGQLITDTHGAIDQWLAGTGALPAWPGLEALAPARAHPGRHGALLLPWTAASMALSHRASQG